MKIPLLLPLIYLPLLLLGEFKNVEKYDNIYKVLDIIENENINFKGMTNILDFYIKINESDEVKAKVLIDSGSDINCIHPEFARVNNIKLMNIDNSFKVAGLDYSLSTVCKDMINIFSTLINLFCTLNYLM